MNPKEGQRPKAAAPLLGAAGGRDNIFVKKYKKCCPKNDILTFFDDFEPPEDDFSRIFRGSSEIVDFGYFYYFLTILRGPSGIHQNRSFLYFFTIFDESGVL